MIGAPEILIIVTVLVLLVIPVLFLWALIDALRHPDSAWSEIDQNKIVWILVVIFLPLLGSILYLSMIRGKLSRVASD